MAKVSMIHDHLGYWLTIDGETDHGPFGSVEAVAAYILGRVGVRFVKGSSAETADTLTSSITNRAHLVELVKTPAHDWGLVISDARGRTVRAYAIERR